MAETAITAVLSKLAELVVGEYRLLSQVKEDIVLLQDKLEWLHAFVREADRKRRVGTDGLTRVWVRQTRDIAFEAEDAVDDFFYDEVIDPAQERKSYGRVQEILHTYFTCFFSQIVVRHGLSDRINSIKSRLEQISVNQKQYNIKHTPTLASLSSTTGIAAWNDDLENPVGFEADVEILMRMLQNDQMAFISVIGESGAGKNTLAKIIRREMAMLPEMEVFVWYHMEPGCSIESLNEHLSSRAHDYIYYRRRLTSEPPWNEHEFETLNQKASEVSRCDQKIGGILAGKRYLLILGGVTSKDILNCLRASLPHLRQDSDNGSSVILILDNENEDMGWHANTMNRNGTNGIHWLPRLDQGRSREIFFSKVLRKGQSEEGSTSSGTRDSEYSRLVYEITGGYPMAIVLLAGLLRFKEKPTQWDAALQQLKSDCGAQYGSNKGRKKGIINQQANLCGTRRAMEIIFWASFEDLPNDLKSCFLYLASYPKYYSYSADTIIQMWIAEGFIKQPGDGKTMEERANDYLKELVLRFLVEVEEMKSSGRIKLVRVHKTIMELLRSEATEAGFMKIHNTDDTHIPLSVRRLSVQSVDGSRYTSSFDNKKITKLRSFICHIMIIHLHQQELKFLRWSRFIRVISVQGLNIKELPDEIGTMINLWYLRISSQGLRRIPSGIARLLHLQTLDIGNTCVQLIDDDFWKIKTLRHVVAFGLVLPIIVPLVQSKDGGGSELQTLHGVRVAYGAEWGEGNCPLDNMENLRSLAMSHFVYASHSGTAFRTALKKMHLLAHLRLSGDQIPSYVLTHQNLRSLQTMILYGSVKWDDVIQELPMVDHPLRMARPNLVQLKLNSEAVTGMPQSIREQLEGILIEC